MKRLVLFLTAVSVAQSALSAQLVPAAPVLGSEKDADGRPLPFGRQPVEPYDKPLGTGPFKAIMATDASLPAHVLYYPKDLKRRQAPSSPSATVPASMPATASAIS